MKTPSGIGRSVSLAFYRKRPQGAPRRKRAGTSLGTATRRRAVSAAAGVEAPGGGAEPQPDESRRFFANRNMRLLCLVAACTNVDAREILKVVRT